MSSAFVWRRDPVVLKRIHRDTGDWFVGIEAQPYMDGLDHRVTRWVIGLRLPFIGWVKLKTIWRKWVPYGVWDRS